MRQLFIQLGISLDGYLDDDSGAPVFVNIGAVRKIIGINSFTISTFEGSNMKSISASVVFTADNS